MQYHAIRLNEPVTSGQGLGRSKVLTTYPDHETTGKPEEVEKTARYRHYDMSGSIELNCKALNGNHTSLIIFGMHAEHSWTCYIGDKWRYCDTIHGQNPAPVGMMYIPAHPIKHSTVSIFTIPTGVGRCLSIVRANQTHFFLHNAL